MYISRVGPGQNKMKRVRIIRPGVVALATILLVLSFCHLTSEGNQDSQKDGVTIIRSDDYGIILELITSSFKAEEKLIDDLTYQVIKLPYTHGQTADPGKPEVPVKGILLGTPYSASIKIKILDYDEVLLSDYNLYPAPGVSKSDDALPENRREEDLRQLRHRPHIRVNVKPYFSKDDYAYSRDKFYPDVLAGLSPAGSLRGQKVAKLKLYPIQFNPGTGKIRFFKRIKVEVDFGPPAEVDWERDSQPPEPFKKIYKGLLHNYKETRLWKGAKPKPFPKPSPIPLRDPAYKISVDEDGIYRLTWEDLAGAGLDPSSLDPRTIKIFNQGKEIPLYLKGEDDASFDSEDYIEFYAKANNTRFSSTNVYWLTTSGQRGLRMKRTKMNPVRNEISNRVQEVKDETPLTPASFLSIHHLEKNDMYWMELPDRGFIDDHWFFKDILWDGASKAFTLPLMDAAVIDNEARIEIFLQGISYGLSEIDHHSRIYLNANLIDDARWGTNAEYKIEKKVPQSYLNKGNNIITVELPGDTGAPFELVLVNWFKISFWQEFKAEEDGLKFNQQGDGLYLYKISNFTGDDIGIFDITEPDNAARITNFDIQKEYGAYTVSFKDRLTGGLAREYLVLTSDRVKKPVSLIKDTPSNLTSYENGADYIIITHEDFYDKVLPLAGYYTSQGLRVSVVKVGDIYDEFNHGVFHPQAIKDFLNYAYNYWQKPGPTYVLLVGDGTYDYLDYGGFGVKNYVPTYMVHSLDFGETASDNWFVCLDGADDILPDMFIGRFPAKTAEEVEVLVNKTINYHNN